MAEAGPAGRGPELLTLDEVARRTGLTPEVAAQVWRAAGFPEPAAGERVFEPDDVAVFESFRAGLDVFGLSVLLQFTRVMGAATTRVADASAAMFASDVGRPLHASGASADDLAQAGAAAFAAAGTLLPVLGQLYLRHLPRAIERFGRIPTSAGTVGRAVAFVDLVDSTQCANAAGVEPWAAAMEDFEATAMHVAVDADVTPVKFIGDEVMLAAVDAARLLGVVMRLLAATAEHAVLPEARAGMAVGPVVAQGGDLYGPTVNLAARAVGLAPRGGVVVAVAPGDAPVPLGAALTPLGAVPLAGFTEPIRTFLVAGEPLAPR